MKRVIQPIIFIFLITICISCDIKNSDVSPDYNFVKVYNDANVTTAYYPIDAIETSNGDIIILSATTETSNTNYPTIHLMKTDNYGNVIWERAVDASYVSPVGSLMQVGSEIRFICMDDISFRVKILAINESSGIVTEVGETTDNYPLASHYSSTTNTTVILSYNGIGRNTVISAYDETMGLIFKQSSPTNKDFSYDIFQHLKKQRNPFPFFINSFLSNNSTIYCVNAFSNYTLSLLFINHNSGNINGRVNGYQELGGIGASINKDEGLFAIAESRFNVGEISLGPEISININGIQNVTQLDATGYPELSSESMVKIIKDEFNGKELVVYASTTKSNQLALFFFDADTNELVHTKYLGHTHPVEISSFLKANDGGLIIVGKTWISGRFQRIILYKVAEDELKLPS